MPSVSNSATYCLINAFFGSVRNPDEVFFLPAMQLRRESAVVLCNSGIKSDGFRHMKRARRDKQNVSVRIIPYALLTVVPSMIGKISRCTPSRRHVRPVP